MEPASLSGSAKRAKAPSNINQIAYCLVDGCSADLSQCREYHRRHKVCELHSKTSKVTIRGREQRFCQQCSRFHSLVEFDEGKRSCRKRLDGHNRRRRKPQHELSRNSGFLYYSHQGTRLLSFSTPQVLPTSVGSSAWSGVVKPENDVVLYNNQSSSLSYTDRPNTFPESSSHSFKEVNQVQFIQSTDRPLLDLDQNPKSGHANSGTKIFSDGLNQVIHPDRALSLLSSAPAVTREIGFSPTVQPDSISHEQSLLHNMPYDSPGQFTFDPEMESKQAISEAHSQVSNNANATFHFQEVFHNGPDESCSSGSHQTLTFLWE